MGAARLHTYTGAVGKSLTKQTGRQNRQTNKPDLKGYATVSANLLIFHLP